jgi:hypothetical protein
MIFNMRMRVRIRRNAAGRLVISTYIIATPIDGRSPTVIRYMGEEPFK